MDIAVSVQLCHHIHFRWNSGFTVESMSHPPVLVRSFVIGLSTRVCFWSVCKVQPPPRAHLKTCFTFSVYFTRWRAYQYSLCWRSLCCFQVVNTSYLVGNERSPSTHFTKASKQPSNGNDKLYNSNQNSCETAQEWFWWRRGESKVIGAAALEKQQLCQQKEQCVGHVHGLSCKTRQRECAGR